MVGVGMEWGNRSSKAFGVSVADRPKAKRKKLSAGLKGAKHCN
jgi:hypothetical protein